MVEVEEVMVCMEINIWECMGMYGNVYVYIDGDGEERMETVKI